jgi:hypothetical protein
MVSLKGNITIEEFNLYTDVLVLIDHNIKELKKDLSWDSITDFSSQFDRLLTMMVWEEDEEPEPQKKEIWNHLNDCYWMVNDEMEPTQKYIDLLQQCLDKMLLLNA